MALFVLQRTQIGNGGVSGPAGLLDEVAAKAAQGMKVFVVQGATHVLLGFDHVVRLLTLSPSGGCTLDT